MQTASLLFFLLGHAGLPAETPPVFQGIAEDWRTGFVAVGSPKAPKEWDAILGPAIGILQGPGQIAIIRKGTVTVVEKGKAFSHTDPRLDAVRGVGWTSRGPVVLGRGDKLYEVSKTSLSTIPIPPAKDAVISQIETSHLFRVIQLPSPESWLVELWERGKRFSFSRQSGSVIDQRLTAKGLFVSSEGSGLGKQGALDLYRPDHKIQLLVRERNARIYLGQGKPEGNAWIAIAKYRHANDHVATTSLIKQITPDGRLFGGFEVSFEFRPFGLDGTGKWLLGIRVRGLHAGASDLIAIRITDQERRVLRSGCVAFWGLPG